LKAASYEALFGLLAVSSMRVGEAPALGREDVDLDAGVITIRERIAKLEKARLVPVHPTTVVAIDRYASERDQLCPTPRSSRYFISSAGTGLTPSEVAKTLRNSPPRSGFAPTPSIRSHTSSGTPSPFAHWSIGSDPASRSTSGSAALDYLGHVSPAESYWYLTATPELMGRAADRLERHLGARP
jgi:integrase